MIVSVAVVTYNASKFVVETLESIYDQSYPNLELIVSDDCSNDDTVAVVNQWIAQDKIKNRFQRIQLLTVPKNTGVSANCNRTLAAISSEWFKFIAGDDILLRDCITDNMVFVGENPGANIIFSKIRRYYNTFREEDYIIPFEDEIPSLILGSNLSADDQHKLLLVVDRISITPSFFGNKNAIMAVGGYDENNKLVEDYPMWLKLTASGQRLWYFNKETVGYRIHATATNNTGDNFIFKPSIFNSFQIRKQLTFPNLPWEIVQREKFVYHVSKFFHFMNWNHKTKTFLFLYKLACVYCNPFYYVYAFKRRLPHNKNNYFYK